MLSAGRPAAGWAPTSRSCTAVASAPARRSRRGRVRCQYQTLRPGPSRVGCLALRSRSIVELGAGPQRILRPAAQAAVAPSCSPPMQLARRSVARRERTPRSSRRDRVPALATIDGAREKGHRRARSCAHLIAAGQARRDLVSIRSTRSSTCSRSPAPVQALVVSTQPSNLDTVPPGGRLFKPPGHVERIPSPWRRSRRVAGD